MIERAAIVAEARSWLDTRFHHQARVKGHGCDCVGLIIGVQKALGISQFDTVDYARQPDGVSMKAHCDREMIEIPVSDIAPGDVLLFRWQQDPQHLAIVGDYPGGGLSIIHAYAANRKVIEARLDDAWCNRIVSAYKLPGVEQWQG